MRSRKFIFIIIFLIIVISTIYVINNPRPVDDVPQTANQSLPTGVIFDDLKKQIREKMSSIERYYQDTELSYEYSDAGDGISSKKSLNMVMTSRVDVTNKTLWASINSTLSEGNMPVEVQVEIYSTGDDLYVDMHTDGESAGWLRSKQIISSWDKLVSFENIHTVLEEESVLSSRSDVYKDIDCYVLVIPVRDIYTIYRILKNSYGLENQFRYTFELIQSFSDDFIFEIWIDKDSLFVVKTVVGMNVEVTPERVAGLKADFAAYSLRITTDNYNINQPFAIELPEELDDATMIYTINE